MTEYLKAINDLKVGDEWSMTLSEFVKLLVKYDAGMMSMIGRKKDEGEILFAVIGLRGEGTQEILDAVDKIYARQDADALQAEKDNENN